jgi:hypothetical protein
LSYKKWHIKLLVVSFCSPETIIPLIFYPVHPVKNTPSS